MSTPTESKTPRTDAEMLRQENWADETKSDTFDCWMATFTFARTLERELNAAQQRIAELEKLLTDANRGAERNARVNAIMAKDLMEAKLRIAELEEDKA